MYRSFYHAVEYDCKFLIGTSELKEDDNEIELEMKAYDDLIVGDFEDRYDTLQDKTYFGYKFVLGLYKIVYILNISFSLGLMF